MSPARVWHPSLTSMAFAVRAVEPLVLLVLALLAFYLRQGLVELPTAYLALMVLGIIVFCGVGNMVGIYDYQRLRHPLGGIPRTLMVLVGCFVFLVTLLFLLKISSNVSRVWLVLWLCLSAGVIIVARVWASRLIKQRLRAGQWRRRVAVVGVGPKGMEILRRLEFSRGSEAQLVGLYALQHEQVGSDLQRSGIFRGRMKDLQIDARNGMFDDLIIGLDMDTVPEVEHFKNFLHTLSVNVFYCLPIPFFELSMAGVTNMEHVPLVLMFRRPLEGHSLWLKRMLDIGVSGLALIMLAPLLVILAGLVKLSSPGPVFFKQKRNGFNGDEFEMLKFRSMRVGAAAVLDADGKELQAGKTDARITMIGRFLRRSSLDELPQLINVLRGDMSLVGPRPHAVSHNNYYENLIDRYASRHKIRPGLTGWAQLNGARGETETVEKMARRVELDIWYVENWSLWLDIKIILLTPWVMVFQRNAY